ncbi:MAG: EAL domain-containing protein [Gammaproteobacteria bacterium]|nr:EAL domain-containing protein [Gammaproteobacteria bacterium]
MNKLSLSLKLTFSFAILSVATLVFLYFTFFSLFEQQMLRVEKEKAKLIAQTIEPVMAMNYYLDLTDEIVLLAEQTSKNKEIIGMRVVIDEKDVWNYEEENFDKGIIIVHPIIEPVNEKTIGNITLFYKKDAVEKALLDMHRKILLYLGGLAIMFILFAFITRYLLRPLAKIAQKVKGYKLGEVVDFSSIRTEPETEVIINAFKGMVGNIREYTVLLERYKHSVDESSIVVRMDLNGNITYVNDEFCRVSGYSEEESVGSSITTRCYSDVDKKLCSDMLDVTRKKQIWKNTLKSKSKEGRTYYVKTTVVPILDENDEIIELISIQHDITQIIEQQKQITRQTTDSNTGLPNRIKLEEDIKGLSTPKFALISLDNYKIIKDYYGYSTGQLILKEIAELFIEFAENRNIAVYKLAGGEYGLLINQDIDIREFHQSCRVLLNIVDDYSVQLDHGSFHIRASAGLTQNNSHLLSYAGLALQHAHETRHSTIIYEEAENLIQRFEDNLLWTKKLNLALKENRIVLYAQPILNTATLKVEKYECLVRMIDDGKVIAPFFFLDIAKKSKLYHQITEQVISIAFDIFSKVPDVQFSINFSLEDLVHAQTIEFLKGKLDETGLASRLILEIVESEGIDNFKEISDFIADMKSRGCKIAIDDFGTGYSNFAYLLQLDVDYIKVDGSLIKTIDQDLNSQIITSTILDFSRQLGIATVAEFVHSQSVLDYVTKMGLDYVQGFHLGEPVEIENLLPGPSVVNQKAK